MRRLTRLWFTLRGALFRRRVSGEIDDELRYHLEMRARALMDEGMSAAAAHREARLRFGNYEATRLLCHELYEVEPRTGDGRMTDFLQDLRYAVRTLVRSPGFSFVVVLTLALGIGANTAIFSVVDGVLLRPLPYPEPDALVVVSENDRLRGTTREGFSGPDFLDVLERNDVFAEMAAFTSQPFTLTGDGADPIQFNTTAISPAGLALLGASPVAGRGFTAEDGRQGGAPVVVLSHRFWQSRYGGDPAVVGRSVLLDGTLHEVIGVMEEEFAFPRAGVDGWRPLHISYENTSRGNHGFGVVARLAPGATVERANIQLEAIAAALEAEFPNDNLGRGMWSQTLYEATVAGVRPALLTLLAAVGLVLLIVCVNVANLLFARATVREREVAIRAALGAGRGRLMRQLLTESAVLAGVGGLVGLGIAFAGVPLVRALGPASVPRLDAVAVDGSVLLFAAAVSLATGLIFGILPAFQVTGADLTVPLKDGAHGDSAKAKQHLRAGLVVVEVAMAVMLTTGAGLLIRSFWQLSQVDPGFQAAGVYSVAIQLPAGRYPQSRAQWPDYPEVRQFHADLLERIRGVPGVEGAALALNNPTGAGWTTRFQIAGRPPVPAGEQEEIRIRTVTDGFFETVRLPVVRGRALTRADDHPNAPPVLLVNEATVRRYFPDDDPIGARIAFWGGTREVVGVVRDVKFAGLERETPPAVYPTFGQMPWPGFQLLIRTSSATEQLAGQVRSVIRALDADLPVPSVAPLDELLDAGVAQPRFNMMLLGTFAATALLLAAVGIYGIMAFSVSRRTHEIGVRLSLGASPADVVRAVVRQGAGLTGVGIGLGLAGSVFASKLLSSLLFGVSPVDIATFGTVSVVGAVVAIAATIVPAARASRVNPIVALKAE